MPLKILVTSKRVEDPEALILVKADGSGIETQGLSYRINPFDEIAVEEALRLKEEHGGEVVVASIGAADCVSEIRVALAMGADRGIRVDHEGPLDPGMVAAILQKLVEGEQPDLVILGKQSVDDDQNQVGQILAQRMGWARATFASKEESLESTAEKTRQCGLRLAADGTSIRVVREVDGGLETLELSLPAVITTDLRLNIPRITSVPGIMKARKKPVREIQVEELGIELQPAVIVRKLHSPSKRGGGLRVKTVQELWDKVHGEAGVL
ncbi:MAG: electron transfer flavoprotein subunit beta/FixA family protein [Treponema sp.]|nr:electron transfer flavoprotein subunit beta/FixA family protein [Treponema sp.]